MPIIGLTAAMGAAGDDPRPKEVSVYAAASLSDALRAGADAYTEKTGEAINFTFGESMALAKKIAAGATPDVYISAESEEPMDMLEERHLINIDSRRNLTRNRLVLIAPQSSSGDLEIKPGLDLAKILGKNGRLAMGKPDSVPVGLYARYALIFLGAWNEVENKLALVDSARAAISLVARGDALLGIVYASDAHNQKNIRVVGEFPPNSHPNIAYAVAFLPGNIKGTGFVDFLRGPEGQAIFVAAGYKPRR